MNTAFIVTPSRSTHRTRIECRPFPNCPISHTANEHLTSAVEHRQTSHWTSTPQPACITVVSSQHIPQAPCLRITGEGGTRQTPSSRRTSAAQTLAQLKPHAHIYIHKPPDHQRPSIRTNGICTYMRLPRTAGNVACSTDDAHVRAA